ncbi:MAG: hypothetical protein ACRC0L_08920 [Angustibacter sp.]
MMKYRSNLPALTAPRPCARNEEAGERHHSLNPAGNHNGEGIMTANATLHDTITTTQGQQDAIAAYLDGHTLAKGHGDRQSACSIVAINLALTGELTDEIPNCMSPVTGGWIIAIQDAMPDGIRNSKEWKSLLPLAAGTGRLFEDEILKFVMNCMWGVALPTHQKLADAGGYGDEWRAMTEIRSSDAAEAASSAASAVGAHCAAQAARTAREASAISKHRTWRSRAIAAEISGYVPQVLTRAAASEEYFWKTINPAKALQDMIEIAS